MNNNVISFPPLINIPGSSLQIEPTKLKSNTIKPIQLDYNHHIQEQLKLFSQYFKRSYQGFKLDYGGHDEQNSECQLNLQQQQNQNKFKVLKIHQQFLPLNRTCQELSKVTEKEKMNLNVQIKQLRIQQIRLRPIQALVQSKPAFQLTPFETQKQYEELESTRSDNHSQQFKRSQIRLSSQQECQCRKQDLIINQQNNRVVMNLQMFEINLSQEDNKFITKKTVQCPSDLQNSKSRKKLKKHEFFPYIKLNQQIGKKEDQLLNQTGRFWTSSMVDAFANYLNGNDEKQYFSLSKQQRQCYKRLFIFTSDFITNCNLNSEPFKDKWLLLMLEKLENFQQIQYQFWIIYEKIAFVVNQNNFHWYLVTVDLKERIIYVYDSLLNDKEHYLQVQRLLTYLFYQLQKNQLDAQNIKENEFQFKLLKKRNFLLQKDGYSCGYFTCIALQYFSNVKQNKNYKDRQKIKQMLKDILLHEIIEEEEQN